MVYAGSPAAEAGVKAGDRIMRINETEVDSIDDASSLNNAGPATKSRCACRATTRREMSRSRPRGCRRPCPANCRRRLRRSSRCRRSPTQDAVAKAGETIELEAARISAPVQDLRAAFP